VLMEHIKKVAEGSLKRFKVDPIDLLLRDSVCLKGTATG